jgi:hypothetical protein
MAKLTLLDIVQDILSDMDSDTVNSINDSVESLQVAQIVKTTFFEIITEGEWPHLAELFQITASGDNSLPTHMTLPENVRYVEWVTYNKRTVSDTKDEYVDVRYKEPAEFMAHINRRDSSLASVTTITDPTLVKLLIINDTAPTYYTSFNNDVLVFDSYDSGVDSTIQSAKIQCYGYREPVFTILDNFIPDLPSKAFPYLLSEAKSVCFNVLKQAANPKEEQRSTRQRRRLSQDRWRLAGGITYPNYGRRGKK